jgi:ATP-NAD kinase N-terminal domain
VGTVGLIVNPHAGKDVRRLVAHATVTTDATKVSIARRVAEAALDVGAERLVVMNDGAGLGPRAVHGLADATVLDGEIRGDGSDTTRAARAMAGEKVAVVVVLGGDGTCRDVVRGWRQAPLLAVSTGTNNVFPSWTEGTVVGLAAGLVASGRVPLDAVARRAKLVHLRDGEGRTDVALIDAVVVSGRFVGTRAMWEPDLLRLAVCARAEPAATGVSAVAGLLAPCSADDSGGVVVTMSPGAARTVRAPMAPGLLCDVGVDSWERIDEGDRVEVWGDGVVALDGERHHVLRPDHRVELWVERDGPLVVDPVAVLRNAAEAGLFATAPAATAT